jgi:hypothetical protein
MSKLPGVQRELYFLRIPQSFWVVVYRKLLKINELGFYFWRESCQISDSPAFKIRGAECLKPLWVKMQP